MPKCKSLTAHCIDWWQSILLVCIRSSQCKNKQCVTIFIHQHERERVPVHKHSLTRSFISMNMNTFTNTNFHQHSYSSAWMWTRPRTSTYVNTLVHQHEREPPVNTHEHEHFPFNSALGPGVAKPVCCTGFLKSCGTSSLLFCMPPVWIVDVSHQSHVFSASVRFPLHLQLIRTFIDNRLHTQALQNLACSVSWISNA